MATVVVLLGLSCLVGACSSARQQETTGSISRQPAQVGSATPLPPIIYAPATVPATQAVAYAPRHAAYMPPSQLRTCAAPRRYDVTASTSHMRPAPAPATKTQFLVHTIAPHETLYSISRLYHTNVNDLAAVNRMAADSRLRDGELLVVPTSVY
jgi:membrane-bound lytic murein transglycosylase D